MQGGVQEVAGSPGSSAYDNKAGEAPPLPLLALLADLAGALVYRGGRLDPLLADHGPQGVGHHHRAVGLLVVLDDGDQDAADGATGVVDGVYTGVGTGVDIGIVDEVKYGWEMMTSGPCDPLSFFVNKGAFDALPADMQKTFLEACKEYQERQWVVFEDPKAYGYETYEEVVAIAKEHGCEMKPLPREIIDQIDNNIMDHLLNKWIPKADEKGKKAAELMISAVEELRGVKLR